MRELSKDQLNEELRLNQLYIETGGEEGRSADLSYANLRIADLSSANLRYANLRYANLRYANLRYANLRSANLRSADLRSADLSSADLSSADLSSANAGDAIPIDGWFFLDCKYNIHICAEWIEIGCKKYSGEEWLDFSDKQIDEMDSGALEWWRIFKSIIITQWRELKDAKTDNQM